MPTPNLIFNGFGRVRSGWRLAGFIVAFLIARNLLYVAVWSIAPLFFGGSREAAIAFLQSNWGFVVQALIFFTTATLVGWGCMHVLEELPWRALGWTLHKGWLLDFTIGSVFGAASLIFAAGIATVVGGFSFKLSFASLWSTVMQTLMASGIIFVFAGAAEEALFRGYPLQTLLRSWPAWLAVIPSSALFAYVHLENPNVVSGFTLVNTTLAGVWLAVAYLRTRSLWFPLGVHWSWNWTMGALLGLPVSGITRLAPSPLLTATDNGPAWLTGGAYGIEGGAACTFALILSTVFIWRTRLVSATEDLKLLTENENPNPEVESVIGR